MPTESIAVCAYGPLSLKCLRSIAADAQHALGNDVTAHYIIVDTASSARARKAVAAIIPDATYVECDGAGPNAAVEAALGLGATWIALIDSSCVASRKWLHSLYWEAVTRRADAVYAPVCYRQPAHAASWRRRPPSLDAPARNMLVRTRILTHNILRFCEGNPARDAMFLRTFSDLGGVVVTMPGRLTVQDCRAPLLTVASAFGEARRRQIAVHAAMRHALTYDRRTALRHALRHLTTGLVCLSAVPLAWLTGRGASLAVLAAQRLGSALALVR